MKLFHRVAEFELSSHDGKKVRFADHLGRYLILYFYPRANTPSCTQQAQGFSARLEEFEGLDAAIVGVSPDKPQVQAEFVSSKGLRIRMLSDPKLELAGEFGAVKDGGILRSTFLIDRFGILRWQWKDVKVESHVEEVLQVLKDLYEADHKINPLIWTRRARRALSSESLPEGEVMKLIEAAHLAPSCFNNQPWRFIVISGEKLKEVKEALPEGNYWAKLTPLIIAVASHRDLDCKLSDGRDYFLFDCGLAVENLVLQATQMGLIAHPIAGYDPLRVKEALAIPKDYILITLVVVGKPGELGVLSDKHKQIELGPRERKPLAEVMAKNLFIQGG